MDTLELKQKFLELINDADEEDLLAVIDFLEQPVNIGYQQAEQKLLVLNEGIERYDSIKNVGITRNRLIVNAIEKINLASASTLEKIIEVLEQPLYVKRKYSEEEFAEMDEIVRKYVSGEERGYSWEEAVAYAREKYSNKHGI